MDDDDEDVAGYQCVMVLRHQSNLYLSYDRFVKTQYWDDIYYWVLLKILDVCIMFTVIITILS